MLPALLLASALVTATTADTSAGSAPADTIVRSAPADTSAGSMPTAPVVAPAPAPAPPRLGGYVQFLSTWAYHDGLTFSVPRARLSADGSLPQRVSYRVLVEFQSAVQGGASTTALRDAYARWSPGPVTVTAGQFKTPFDREYLISVTALETPDYPTVVDSIAPRRDIGVAVEAAPHPAFTLAAGAFNGEGQNVGANRDSVTLLIARAALQPLAGVHLGASGAWNGTRSQRYGLEAGLDWRGTVVRAEWLGQRRPGATPDDGGWFVFASHRVLPWLRVVARQEDFMRPALGAARRVGATIAGVNIDLAGGRHRFLIEYMAERTGSPFVTRDVALAQWLVRF